MVASATKGDVSVTNSSSGYIRGVAATGGTTSYAIGIAASAADGNVSVINDGRVYGATLSGTGTGIQAKASGSVYVANNGYIKAEGLHGSAAGIYSVSTGGTVDVVNTGEIRAYESPQIGPIVPTTVQGIAASGVNKGATVVNSGYVYANGAWTANGIFAGTYGGTTVVTNTATGHIIASGIRASGIFAVEAPYSPSTYGVGTLTVNNAGSIKVNQANDCGCGGFLAAGSGICALSEFGGNITVNNSGSIGVNTQRNGYGIWAWNFLGETTESNSGSITVNSGGTAGLKIVGEYGRSSYGGVSLTNSGNITINSAPYAGNAYAGDLSIGMEGHSGRVGSSRYTGSGDTVLANTGMIDVNAVTGYGMWATSQYALSQASNSGTITVNGDFIAGGISAGAGNRNVPGEGSVLIDNSGNILATAPGGAFGLRGYGHGSGYQKGVDITIDNSGYIDATSERRAQGILTFAFNYDPTVIDNSGTIKANATVNDRTGQYAGAVGMAFGIHTTNYTASAAVTNSGSITADTTENKQSPGAAAGIFTNTGYQNAYFGYAYGPTTISNTGSISASLVSSNATKATRSPQYAAQTAYGAGNTATGILSAVTYGDITIANAGAISASAKSDHYVGGGSDNGTTTANGISVANLVGNGGYAHTYSLANVGITNASTGSITAYAESSYATGDTAKATGISARVAVGSNGSTLVSAGRGITIDNAGIVSATAVIANDPTGIATATGISAVNGSTAGYVNVTNSGSIAAAATTTGVATATGILASGYSVAATLDAGYVGATATGASGTATGLSVLNGNTAALAIGNAGTLKATFVGGSGNAYGANITTGGDLSFTNSGAIVATATNNAVGVTFNNPTPTTLVNSGMISATSAATSTTATATGISLVNGSSAGSVSLTNSGTVLATASTSGEANATGIFASSPDVAIALNAGGYVSAVATGTSGTATALSLITTGTTALAISNPGVINATFNGAGGLAYGADITSAGDVNFTNSGKIFATYFVNAVGLQLNSATNNTLVNSGVISAASSAGNSIAVQTGAANDTFQNTGTINGAIVTGAGNDTLTNSAGGVWNPIGTATVFGAGDDTISNAGLIQMNNSGITLGSGGTAGNTFANSGLITAVGSNSIDLGANNPNPTFTNTGIVDLRSGAPGNSLTLTGNWAGTGQLGVDVDPLKGTSDMLHVVGNVAGGSVTSVNVDLLDLPTTATSSVPVVTVTGTSAPSNFALGTVQFDTAKSFLVVQGVSLLDSNTTPDVFSVGVAVTGVTDSGALAASIVPGVESLMNSEVGTWRQRMGVITPTAQGSVGLWTRAFDDSGTVNPGHIAGNFGQGGNFSFDQTNSGEEIGADFAISQNFTAGLMLGKAQSNQHLDGGGVGSNRISGDTRGAYATWMAAGGFYLDASYRSMSFDARLDSQAGESRTTGNADAFNVELGQSWAFGDGFKLVPQVQYTKTTVDKADTLSGALNGFTPQGGDSSRGRAGLLLSKDIASSGSTVWTPYVSASAVHEFDGENNFIIEQRHSTGSTDTKGTSALVEGGISVKTGKLEVFGGVNWQDGGALKSFAGGQVGLHYNW